MVECGEYRVTDPDALESPAFLVFDAAVDHNLRTVCELAGGGHNLFLHVKTHKSSDVARRQLEAGIAGFKCATLRELEMVLEAGAREAVLAYPLVQRRKAERFAELVGRHPEARPVAVVDAAVHLEALEWAARQQHCRIPVMLDLDLGMHRTGIAMGDDAVELYRAIGGSDALEPAGLHAYDGHEHFTDPVAREAAADRHVRQLQAFRARLEAEGLAVPRVIAGGSYSFPYYARVDGFHGSPGTCAYWDCGYQKGMPDRPFRWAALVLTQVVDRNPGQQTVTTDLGYKAICADPPLEQRALLLGRQRAFLLLQNEEHAVFHLPGELPELGTYLLAAPGHVCSTTVRYPGAYLVDAAGEVIDYYPHTARDRQ